MNFKGACAKVGRLCDRPIRTATYPSKNRFTPKKALDLNEKWLSQASSFSIRCCSSLLNDPVRLKMIQDRGINIESMKRFSIGWNSKTQFVPREDWGLTPKYRYGGCNRTHWLPMGLVIPTHQEQEIIRLKIRRTEWHEGDELPKYIEVSGSSQKPSIFGDVSKPIVIMESEFDAVLLQQEASDLCCSVALGGASKRPDQSLHRALLNHPKILLSLDYDQGGRSANAFWLSTYQQIKVWPPAKGKSLGDSFSIHGVDLMKWIQNGLDIK